jgi:hypothetical protein
VATEELMGLPKGAAEAFIALAYRGRVNPKPLSKLTLLIDGGRVRGRIHVVEVALSAADVDVVRLAAEGKRGTGIAAVAKKVHDAMGEAGGYRSGGMSGHDGCLRRQLVRPRGVTWRSTEIGHQDAF